MATETPGLVITLVAGEDLRLKQYMAVRMESDGAIDFAGASVGEDALGFLQNTPNTGEAATVMVNGITKAVVGTGGITAGEKAQAIADGIAAATTGDHVLGIALDTGLAGEKVRLLLGVTNPIIA